MHILHFLSLADAFCGHYVENGTWCDRIAFILFCCLRRTVKVMFPSLCVCLFVGLFAKLRHNGYTEFHEIFKIGGIWYKTHSIFWLQGFFFMFSRKSVSVSSITGNRMNGFSSKVSAKMNHEASNNLQHFRGVKVDLLNPGSLYYFLDSCLLVTLRENGRTDFHDIFTKWHVRHKK